MACAIYCKYLGVSQPFALPSNSKLFKYFDPLKLLTFDFWSSLRFFLKIHACMNGMYILFLYGRIAYKYELDQLSC